MSLGERLTLAGKLLAQSHLSLTLLHSTWHTNDVVVDEVDELYYHLLIPRSIRGCSQKEGSFNGIHDIILKGINLNVVLFLCRFESEVRRHDEFGKFWDRQIVNMKSSEKLFGN